MNESSFKKAFINEEIFWRIYRKSTFIDKIIVLGNSYLMSPSESKKIDLVNLCIKALIVNKLGEMKLGNSLIEIRDDIDSKKDRYLTEYEKFFKLLSNEQDKNSIQLAEEINYLIVLSRINESVFESSSVSRIAQCLLR